jgi:hypothetical protein
MYQFLNIFFFVFHVALILFNVFAWLFKPLRRIHLFTAGLTLFSWVVLGIFYGFGYCFLTDWHWDVREKLGYTNESNSYIHFLVTRLAGISVSEESVDILTVGIFGVAVVGSVILNIRDYRRTRRSNRDK